MGRLGRVVAAAGIWALGLATGCGNFWVYPGSNGNGSGSSSGNYVYVANATTQSLAGFSVGSGTLTAVTNSPYSLGFAPTAVVVNPANTYLYVGGNLSIYTYSIGSGGALTALSNPIASVAVRSMAITPDGQYLYVLDQNLTTIDWFPINSNGTLGVEAQAQYSTSIGPGVKNTYGVINPTTPQSIAFSPNGSCLFVGLGTAGHLAYPVANDSIGSSTPQVWNLLASVTQSDNALAVSPNSSYLYVTRSGPNGGLVLETVSYASGSMCQMTEPGSPTGAGNHPVSVVVSSAGTDVYVANQLDSTISGYSIGTGGALTELSSSPYTSGAGVNGLAVDKTGNYLLAVAGGGSPDLTVYSYDSATAGKLDIATSAKSGNDPAGAVAIATTH